MFRNKMTMALLGLVASALVVSACVPGAPQPAMAQSTDPAPTVTRTISVSGNGQAYTAPDKAMISIGVQTRDKDAGKAVDNNTAAMNKILAALKAQGIADKDLQTQNFSINPQYEYDSSGNPTGAVSFIVDNTLVATVRNLPKLGATLSSAVSAGANNIYGISFGVQDPSALQATARDLAVADARARAEALAKAAGVTLGEVISISESLNVNNPVPVYARDMAQAVGGDVPVATGEQSVSVDVSVTFAIQ